jgi:enoyl-CoA hydratase
MSEHTRPQQTITHWRHVPVPVRRAIVRSRRWSHLSRAPHPHVRARLVDSTGVIIFDDGKVNVISRQSARLLAATHDRVTGDERVKAVVLTGRVGQFCAGFDLDTMIVGGPRRDDLIRTGWDMLRRYLTTPTPLVVACTGNAVAAGAALLLAGDVRLVTDGDFVIGFNEAAIGLPLPGLLLALAREQLAPDAFAEATAAARMYSPADAVAAGFAHRVVPAHELIPAALDEARRLAEAPDQAFLDRKRAQVAEHERLIEHLLPDDLDLMTHLDA